MMSPAGKPTAERSVPRQSPPNGNGRCVAFDVPQGRQYLILAKGVGFGTNPKLVELRTGAMAVHVNLGPPSNLKTGKIVLSVTRGDLPTQGGVADGLASAPSSQFAVFVDDPLTGVPLAEWGKRSTKSSKIVQRPPPGTVRVVAAGLPWIEDYHGMLMARRAFGRAEALIQVKSGEETPVHLHLEAGGRLRVTITSVPSNDERAAASIERKQFRRPVTPQLTIEDRPSRVSAPVVRVGATLKDWNRNGPHIVQHWPIGETHTSEVLPTGTYTLRATFRDRAPIEKIVTITPAATTHVELDFGG